VWRKAWNCEEKGKAKWNRGKQRMRGNEGREQAVAKRERRWQGAQRHSDTATQRHSGTGYSDAATQPHSDTATHRRSDTLAQRTGERRKEAKGISDEK
jgi:hypothetical protein